jgi:hypothetical protein
MARTNLTSSGRRRKANGRVLRFPQVNGKSVAEIELAVSSDDYAISIIFEDKTVLSFDVDSSVAVLPELSDWKTGDSNLLKTWKPIHSKFSRG